jgi:hypothetical protein
MSLPLPRPVLIAIAGLVLVLAAFMATQVMRPGAASENAAPEFAPAPAKPATRPKRHAAAPPVKHRPSPRATPAPAPPATRTPAKPAPVSGAPAGVAQAIARGQVVVILFSQSGAADDAATGDAVRALRRRHGLAVFSDAIGHLSEYSGIVADLDVSRAPAVVIVGRNKQARLVEGYVDEATLLQQVEDARR